MANQNDLRAALSAAQNNGQDDLIRVVQGHYQWNSGFDFTNTDGQDFYLLGGYAPSTTCAEGSRVVDPTLTILDSNGYDRVVDIASYTDGNTVFVEGFTFVNGAGVDNGAGLEISAADGDTVNIAVFHNIFANNTADDFGGGLSFGCEGVAQVVNNLFYGNHAGTRNGAATLTFNGPAAKVVNNTVVDNTDVQADGCGGMRIGGGASPPGTPTVIRNNIFWNNTHSDLYLTGTPVYDSITNDIGVSGFTPPATSTGDLSVDPLFVPGTNDYHLQLVSPLVEKGSDDGTFPSFDLEVNPRVQGGAPDMGAYEAASGIFSDGFESGDTGAWQ